MAGKMSPEFVLLVEGDQKSSKNPQQRELSALNDPWKYAGGIEIVTPGKKDLYLLQPTSQPDQQIGVYLPENQIVLILSGPKGIIRETLSERIVQV